MASSEDLRKSRLEDGLGSLRVQWRYCVGQETLSESNSSFAHPDRNSGFALAGSDRGFRFRGGEARGGCGGAEGSKKRLGFYYWFYFCRPVKYSNWALLLPDSVLRAIF